MIYFFVHMKMSYYWFNRHELLEKANDRYHNYGGKEEAAEEKRQEIITEVKRSKKRIWKKYI